MTDWSKVVQREWQHCDIDFNSNLGIFEVSFLGETTYSVKAYEVKNLILQTIHNSELEWERYGWLKQCYVKSMQLWDWV